MKDLDIDLYARQHDRRFYRWIVVDSDGEEIERYKDYADACGDLFDCDDGAGLVTIDKRGRVFGRWYLDGWESTKILGKWLPGMRVDLGLRNRFGSL